MLDPERQLWCAVIEQALNDASRPMASSKSERLEQIRARDWFVNASPDFKRACDLAGIAWDQVRSHAVAKIEAARPRDAIAAPRNTKRRGVGGNFEEHRPDRMSPSAQDSI
jgi:hypothetical protein